MRVPYFCNKFLRDSFVRKNKTEGRVINAQNRGKQYYREDGACVLYAEQDSSPPFLFSFFFFFFKKWGHKRGSKKKVSYKSNMLVSKSVPARHITTPSCDITLVPGGAAGRPHKVGSSIQSRNFSNMSVAFEWKPKKEKHHHHHRHHWYDQW